VVVVVVVVEVAVTEPRRVGEELRMAGTVVMTKKVTIGDKARKDEERW